MGWCAEHGIPHSALLAWDATDRAKLVAYLMESAQRCTMCGTAPWEWEEDRFAYEASTHNCRGCQVKETASEDAPRIHGQTITLVPRRVYEHRRAAVELREHRRAKVTR